MRVVMIFFGSRMWSRVVTRLKGQCDSCGELCVQTVTSEVRVLTIFFVPLIPVSKRTFIMCALCGARQYFVAPTKVQADSVLRADLSDNIGAIGTNEESKRARWKKLLEAGDRPMLIRKALASIAVVSSALLVFGLTNSGFRTSFFGSPEVITKTVPIYVTPDTSPTWEIGACLAESADGTSSHPVKCGDPHWAVVVSKVTSRDDCPYFSDYAATYTPHAIFYASSGWCAVKSNVSQQ